MGWPPGGVVEDCLYSFLGTDTRTCFKREWVDLKRGLFCWTNGEHVLNWETEEEEEDGEGDDEDTERKHRTEPAGHY